MSQNKTYKGYYHYWPTEKIAMSGAVPSVSSIPIDQFTKGTKGKIKIVRKRIEKIIGIIIKLLFIKPLKIRQNSSICNL